MKLQHIERSLYKQNFQAWEEVDAELASKGLGYFPSFFDGEEHNELIQAYSLSRTIWYVVWNETERKRENSQA